MTWRISHTSVKLHLGNLTLLRFTSRRPHGLFAINSIVGLAQAAIVSLPFQPVPQLPSQLQKYATDQVVNIICPMHDYRRMRAC